MATCCPGWGPSDQFALPRGSCRARREADPHGAFERAATTHGGNTTMTDTEVAIIGAGPYGLSLAAHLRASGVDYRQFGAPMRLWQSAMPKGMYLKSQGFASNLSDPKRTHTLEAFCKATGRSYASYG